MGDLPLPCPACSILTRDLGPGESARCACGTLVEIGDVYALPPREPHRPRDTEGEAYRLPVGRWCRDDLCWYGPRVSLAEGAPHDRVVRLDDLRSLLGRLAPPDPDAAPRPSTVPRVVDDGERDRAARIYGALERVRTRASAWYRLLWEVYVRLGGRVLVVRDGNDVDVTPDVYLHDVGLRCASRDQHLHWLAGRGTIRPSLPREWARRELALAVAEYDEVRG